MQTDVQSEVENFDQSPDHSLDHSLDHESLDSHHSFDAQSLDHMPEPAESQRHRVLLVSPMADATRAADSLATALRCSVTVAATYRAGLVALRHQDYSVVVVDDCIVEGNPSAAEMLWRNFGLAVPVQINFAFSGGARLAREVQAAISRREMQQVIALRAAASVLESDLKSTITGLLLQSQPCAG